MAIGDDFSIDYTNKMITHSAGTSVYSVNQLYSWLQDQFDELSAMDDLTPMSAQTPTAYTMINSWWLDIGELSYAQRYLNGGAIQTNGYGSEEIKMVELQAGDTDYISTDVGKIFDDDGTNVGPVLGYINDFFGTGAKVWTRDTRGTQIPVAISSVITTDSGTGAGTVSATQASQTGEELFANVFSVGAQTSDPSGQIYIIQDGSRIAEWSNLTNWDRGAIDVLIQVDEAGSPIDSRNLRVFNRQAGDSFSHFDPTITTAGQNVAALATVTDGNDDDVEWYMLYDTEAGGGFTDPSTTNYVIKDVADGTKPGWYATLVSLTDFGTEGLLGLKGLNGTPANNDAIYETATQKGTVNSGATSAVGDAYFDYTGGTDFTTDNQVLTQATTGATALQRANDATNDITIMEIDRAQTGNGRDTYYVDMDTTNTVTGATTGSATPDNYARGIAGFDDITVAHINGTATHGGTTGSFVLGERVVITGGLEGIVIEDSGSGLTLANVHTTATGAPAIDINGDTATGDIDSATCVFSQDLQLGHVTNQNFTLQSTAPYAVFIEGGAIYNTGRSLKQVYEYLKYALRDGSILDTYVMNNADTLVTLTEGQAFIVCNETYTVIPANPYGGFTGTAFQGAQGIWVTGQAAADINNLELTDNTGAAQAPNPTVTITIGNTVSGDRIGVFLDDGTGLVEKDMYQSHATNNALSDSTFELDGTPALTNDTPTTGAIIVVAADEVEEHRYRFTSFSKTPDIFTLATEGSGTAEGTSTGDQLDDTGAFADAEVDDIIRNIIDGTWGYIRTKTDNNQVFTQTGFGSNALTWDSGDTFEYNSLIQAYDGSDTVYVPYIHDKATTITHTQNILYVSDRTVIIRVRNVADATPIKPFESPGTINNTGLTQNVIRDEDTIFQ